MDNKENIIKQTLDIWLKNYVCLKTENELKIIGKTIFTYISFFDDYKEILATIRSIHTDNFFPYLGTVTKAIRIVLKSNYIKPHKAWEMVVLGRINYRTTPHNFPNEITEALAILGGWKYFKDKEPTDADRAKFISSYENIIEDIITEEISNKTKGLELIL